VRNRSIAFDVSAIVLLVITSLLAAAFLISYRWQKSWIEQESRRGLLLAGDTLRASLRSGMLLNRREEIGTAIRRVADESPIAKIRIVSHSGRIGLSTTPGEVGREFMTGWAGCRTCHSSDTAAPHARRTGRTMIDKQRIRSFTPIFAEAGCRSGRCHQGEVRSSVLGLIDMSLPLAPVEATLNQIHRNVLLLFAGVALAGSCLIFLFLSRRLRRPLRELVSGMRRVSGGDLDYRIPEKQTDELGVLAASFNRMSERLGSLRESLIRNERLISMGKLAAGVAHEINNPLTGILSYAEDLVEGTAESDPRRADYEIIVREAIRCRTIIRNLLDFAGDGKPRRVPLHPGKLIEQSLALLTRRKDFAGISLVREIEPGLPEVIGNPVQIQQVLINLIVNARQAMPQGGKITVGAIARGLNSVSLFVRDQGPGVPADIRERIFEPFFSTKDGYSDGLGLAVCLGIVERLGGRIEQENVPQGGAIFSVILPAAAGERDDDQENPGRG
jgi:two-component system, NtrC family, sensor kinase